MLDTALATEYVPGTNIKGEVAGANWIFLLPNFELGRILCLGLPEITSLITLSRIGQKVFLIITNETELKTFKIIREEYDLCECQALFVSTFSRLPLRSESIDLILIANPKLEGWPGRQKLLVDDLRRLQSSNGLMYFEFTRFEIPFLKDLNIIYSPGFEKQQKLFWLTPLKGETLTAIPASDSETKGYFFEHSLFASSIDLTTLKHLYQLLGKKKYYRKPHKSDGQLKNALPNHSIKTIKSILQWAVIRFFRSFQYAEFFISKHVRIIRRTGVLIEDQATEPTDGPPRYICSIALQSGIDLSGYRWGLSAQGDYSSRKILFFLFNQEHRYKNDHGPDYIVKLVRNPAYNYRLENEYRALSLLVRHETHIRESVPTPVFFGYHCKLAIVGQTMIEGKPLNERTDFSAECPYLERAIDFLTDLAVDTADPYSSTPDGLAQALGELFNRFDRIYQLSPSHRTFLLDQISAVKSSKGKFPLVFQHGDAGTWNALITDDGKVVFLDWEAAEPEGVPLWDLFYFLRSYLRGVARHEGTRDAIRGIYQQFLINSPNSNLVIGSVQQYCCQVGLPRNFIEPLFYTCWMHRALKEATRILPEQTERGHYVNLLRFFIDYRKNPILNELFSI